MLKCVLKSAVMLISVLIAQLTLAQDAAPDAALKADIVEVTAVIRQDKDIQAGNPAKVADLVETKILPLFDFTRTTQIAVGRNWCLATPAQQDALIREFKTLLARTYSTALSSYRDQVIEFKRLRIAPGDNEVTVKSVMKQPWTAPVTMDYNMEKSATGWKTYDIKVDGISMIATYRETFSGKVRESGVDGLIKLLSDKNRQGDVRARTQTTDDYYSGAFVHTFLLVGR